MPNETSFRTSRASRIVYDAASSTKLQELKRLISDKVDLIAADDFPIQSLLAQLAKGKAHKRGWEWEYWTDMLLSETVEVKTAAAKGVTTISLTDNTHVNVGDLVLHFIGTSVEGLYVSAVDSGGEDVTVTREFGGAGHDILAGDVMINTHNISGDGSSAPAALTLDEVKIEQVGIFQRTAIDLYGMYFDWEKYTDGGGQGYFNRKKNQRMMEHKRGFERKLIYGHKKISIDSDGNPTYVGMGLLEFIKNYAFNSQIIDVGGQLTEQVFWEDIVGACQTRALGTKIAFMGRVPNNAISKWERGNIQNSHSESITGISIDTIRNPINRNDIKIVYHSNLNQLQTPEGTKEGVLKDQMIILDLDNVEYFNLSVLITHGKDHVIINGNDILTVAQTGNKAYGAWEILQAAGIEWHDADSHAFVYNMDSFI